ncbi:PREDICTED: rho GTPase-activating protein 15, partial [Merops nubicus]|uniref:rho GTPase-activating protein 15 n=1 Tax=Merops nubicus TaxID=57421 RepID=UPI0004F01552
KPGYKPECVDLCGARIEWTSEKSSRKNVFQITTVSGNEFLLQSDIDFLILDWFHAIKNAIDRLPKERSCTSRNLEFKLRRSSSIELLNSLDTESKEPKPEHRKSLIFRLNYSASDTNDRNRVKSRLKKFISRRPSLKTLQEKGLIKDQIFGSHLHLVCEHEKSTVPQFVRLCINAVEKRGLDVDGIYRVSGNLATIQKLRFVVNQ